MKKMRYLRYFVMMALVAIIACSSGADAEKIANALTDRLGFNNATIKDGEAPAPNTGAAYPQVTKLQAPDTIKLDEEFQVVIQTDFETATDVKGAVLKVENASKYMEVTETMNPANKLITLTGKLTNNEEIPSDQYKITVALQKSDGSVGSYMEWLLNTPLNNADCESACKEIDSKGCFEENEAEYCVEECNSRIRTKKCYDCVFDNSDCEEMWQCINSECLVTNNEGDDSQVLRSDGDTEATAQGESSVMPDGGEDTTQRDAE